MTLLFLWSTPTLPLKCPFIIATYQIPIYPSKFGLAFTSFRNTGENHPFSYLIISPSVICLYQVSIFVVVNKTLYYNLCFCLLSP